MTNIVQVLGPARTGTTITHLMLGNGENAFACGEVYALFRPWRTDQFKPKCACGKTYKSCMWREYEKIPEEFFYSNLAKIKNVEWIIDESKRLGWLVDSHKWALNNNMKTFNILMYKKPENLIHSQWKRGLPVDRAARTYKKYYGRFLKLGMPYISVDLDELSEDPASKNKKLCEAIGMSYFEGKEIFWNEKQQCHLFGSPTLREQMKNGGMKIRSEPLHSKEFSTIVKKEIEKFNKDKELLHIQNALIKHEVNSLNPYVKNFEGNKVIYPAWYYKEKIFNRYQRLIPKKAN